MPSKNSCAGFDLASVPQPFVNGFQKKNGNRSLAVAQARCREIRKYSWTAVTLFLLAPCIAYAFRLNLPKYDFGSQGWWLIILAADVVLTGAFAYILVSSSEGCFGYVRRFISASYRAEMLILVLWKYEQRHPKPEDRWMASNLAEFINRRMVASETSPFRDDRNEFALAKNILEEIGLYPVDAQTLLPTAAPVADDAASRDPELATDDLSPVRRFN